jgi:DNA repair protein RecO (recombination protein O)
MKQYRTQGIVLTRTDYAEADRILTFLTPDHGKVRAIAKGVRKSKSKLAGGIELFSVSDLSLIIGRGEVNTLISTRLVEHYGNIVKDLKRTEVGYELIRLSNKATEDGPEPAYFNLLKSAFEALDDTKLDPQLTFLWFNMQLLKLSGHEPNLKTDISGRPLATSATYEFHLDRMRFTPKLSKEGLFTANHIKFLRLGFDAGGPRVLQRVSGVERLAESAQPLVQTMLQSFVRI